MAWSKPVINKISTDIKDLTIYLRTIKKWGKSTLFRDVILEKYGDPSYGVSVSCGKEKGEKLLDNLNKTRIQTYKDALELKNWLVQTKGKEHNIEIISFDTVDELVPIFEKETIRISNIENPQKKVKTINGAMGGYQEGQRYTANELIKTYMDDLQEAGFGIWAISHTKFKNIKEKGGLEEDGYMQLTSNLVSAYEAAFGDIFDVTLTGVIDRDVEEKEVTIGEKTKIKRYATDSVRKLYFRGTPLIDAGGRFAFDAVPEYMVFDKPNMAKDFIHVIEEGMEKSKTNFSKKPGKSSGKTKARTETTDEEITDVIGSMPETEEPENNIDSLESEDTGGITDNEEISYPDDLKGTIRKMFKDCKDKELKAEVKGIITGYGKLDNCDNETLKNIYDKLK